MMRKNAFLLMLVTALTISTVAYGAVENVKLSGDITVRGLYRDDYSLTDGNDVDTFNGSAFRAEDPQNFWMSQVRLRVDADLVKNVEGQIELLNQRDVDPPSGGASGSGLTAPPVIAGAGNSAANDQFDVILSLANITIKELYWPELTVRVGRQNIQWGEGFVIGNNQLGNPDPSATLTADEFTMFHGFDAVRAMVNKGAWHFDGVFARIQENQVNRGDDEGLLGINIGRTFDAYSSEAEIYYLQNRNSGATNAQGDVFLETEVINAMGVRGSIRPWERLKLSAETVFQFGEEGGANGTAPQGRVENSNPNNYPGIFNPNGIERQNIAAWAYDLRAEWEWREAIWPTNLGAEWVFYSGEERTESDNTSNNYRPLYRGKFHSAIREFQGFFYLPEVGVTPGYMNQNQLIFDASFHPFNNKDLTFFTRVLFFWFDEEPIEGRDNYIGTEWDTTFNYAYTEDLNLKLIGAFFNPGSYFETHTSTPNSFGTSEVTARDTAKMLTAEVALLF